MWTLLALAHALEPSSTERLLVDELNRATDALSRQPEAPHYIGLTVQDWHERSVMARDGTLFASRDERSRYLDVDLRVGTPELDSSHELRGFSSMDGDSKSALQVPLDDGPAMRHAVWRELDGRTRDARERIVLLRANLQVKVEEESPAADFQPLPRGNVDRREVPAIVVDLVRWTPALVAASQRIEGAAHVIDGSVRLASERVVVTMVDSEGARLQHGRRRSRLAIQVEGVAPDGDQIRVFRSIDVHDAARLPEPGARLGWVDEALDELAARMAAPRGEPYSGPVILTGEASGVFFHEVMGHRVEGHRQKRETEGKTFADHVGRPVLPAWIDVVDDPTVAEAAGEQLNGHYRWDDEGVAGAPAVLVDDGVFRGFLMSRSPIPGFSESNGHGRRSVGRDAVARMGNTLVTASKTSTMAELRRQLLAELRAQQLPYGYLVDEIEGGFTLTGRVMPNAFNVRATNTWRIYADGRPDERVRGLDLVGTPLVAFSNLLAAGDTPEVFNGSCGAESGWVPVSAVAPALLFRTLEFQLKEKGQERPPLWDRPLLDADGDADASEVTR